MKLLSAILSCLLMVSPAFAGANSLKLHQGAYDSAAQRYFNSLVAYGCTTPTPAFKLAVSNYVKAKKAHGNWGGDDFIYILATADSCTASVNLAQPTLYKLTWNGSCTFAVATGLTGDGSTCYGDDGVNISQLTRISRNNSHLEICQNIPINTAFGTLGAAGVLLFTGILNKGTKITSSTTIVDSGVSSAGCNFAWRTSSSIATTGRDGVINSNGIANASAALNPDHFSICRNSAAFCPNTSQIFLVEVGQPIVSESLEYTDESTLISALGGPTF